MLTSNGRAAANAQNALQSTGPRTASGKARSRLNALKHGLLSGETLLAGEEVDALSQLTERLRKALDPQGELESFLVDRIVSSVWRLRRLNRIEAGVVAWYQDEILVERARREVRSHEQSALDAVASLQTPMITNEEAHRAAAASLREAEARQEEGAATLGLAFVKDARGPDAFSKLSRYEAAIERGLYRALHELQRLQATRTGQPVASPVAIDVNVSAAE